MTELRHLSNHSRANTVDGTKSTTPRCCDSVAAASAVFSARREYNDSVRIASDLDPSTDCLGRPKEGSLTGKGEPIDRFHRRSGAGARYDSRKTFFWTFFPADGCDGSGGSAGLLKVGFVWRFAPRCALRIGLSRSALWDFETKTWSP